MSAISDARVALVFGTDTGNTEDVGEKICEQFAGLGVAVEMVNIVDIDSQYFADYDLILMGIPTWDFGELQEDWADMWTILEKAQLQGKTCAVFGLGDQIGYSEWFLDAMGLLHDRVQEQGAVMVGYWSADGYKFEDSKALTEARTQFVGLAIDEDCQHGETQGRVQQWCQQILTEFGMD